jgi:hypothetical protein
MTRIDQILKQKQAFWETPRNIAILTIALAVIVSAVAFWVGYGIGQNQQPPLTIVIQQQPAGPPK